MPPQHLQEISRKNRNSTARAMALAAFFAASFFNVSRAAAQTSANLNPLTRAAAMPHLSLQDAAPSAANTESSSEQCTIHITANDVIVSDHERQEVGYNVQPPGIIPDPGAWPYFAWSDTPLGIVPNSDGSGYLFFGSDGGCHENCNNQNTWRWGSISVSQGTLAHPLGKPLGNPNPPVYEYAFPASKNLPTNIDYVGGGPVYRVPAGEPGAGSLLIVYHAERNALPFWSWLGIAKSTDDGMSWQDLGLVVSPLRSFSPKGAADIGDGTLNVVTDPATGQKYFYLFFPGDCWINNVVCPEATWMSVARASYEDVLTAAAGGNSVSGLFLKYYNGAWTEPGLDGKASELFPDGNGETGGAAQVVWSAYRNRFVATTDSGSYIAYGESSAADGLYWPPMQVLLSDQVSGSLGNATPVGFGNDPTTVGDTFYVFYDYDPIESWQPAMVKRLTLTTAATTTSAQPNVATAGSAAFTLAVFGEHFSKKSTVLWNNSPRATTFASGTLLYAQILASDIASPGTANITVETPAPCGGNSNTQPFTIEP